VLLVATPTAADKVEPPERRGMEGFIKNEDPQTLSDRTRGFLQLNDSIPGRIDHLPLPRSSAAEQFLYGHYFGCIALAQSVLEAVILHVWQIKLNRKPNNEDIFDKNIDALHKQKVISDEWKG
jgi:hypothetical protein